MPKAYATTYCDGTQTGCRWNATAHASTSTRSAQSRAGGRWRDLYDDYNLSVVATTGWGMPPVKHNVTAYSILPGALLQSIKTEPRVFTLVMEPAGGSLSNIHGKRDNIIEATKPDLVSPNQAVRLKYTGATNQVMIEAYYAGGLEGALDGEKGVSERIPVRFVAYTPHWYAPIETAASLTTKSATIAATEAIIKKADGTWAALGNGIDDGVVYTIAQGADGTIYVGGSFTTVAGAAISRIASWNGTAWSALGTGAANGTVYSIVIGASGTLYAAGTFSGMGGVANTQMVAQWNGSAWSAMVSGVTAGSYIEDLAIGNDSGVYAVGDFTTIGGVGINRVAKWNGTAWTDIGGASSSVRACTVSPNGDLYIGGNFSDVNGGTVIATRIAKYDGTTWTALGSGVNNTVYAIAVGPDGTVYAGGTFTTAGGNTANYIAKWNGTSWSALGSGITGSSVTNITPDSEGGIYVGGSIATAGGLSIAEDIAYWNGTAWVHLDIDTPSSADVEKVLITTTATYYGYGFNAGGATASAKTTVTVNGSSTVYPKLVIKRTGGTSATLQWLKNETTGDTCWFDYALQDGETLTVDFAAGSKTVTSDYYGNVLSRGPIEGSDFATWKLLPGSNDVTLYISDAGTPTLTAYLLWQDSYYSPDGAQ